MERQLRLALENAGVRGKQVRHRAIVVHLDHPRGYREEAALKQNRAIRDRSPPDKVSNVLVDCGDHYAKGWHSTCTVGAFPISIDIDAFRNAATLANRCSGSRSTSSPSQCRSTRR